MGDSPYDKLQIETIPLSNNQFIEITRQSFKHRTWTEVTLAILGGHFTKTRDNGVQKVYKYKTKKSQGQVYAQPWITKIPDTVPRIECFIEHLEKKKELIKTLTEGTTDTLIVELPGNDFVGIDITVDPEYGKKLRFRRGWLDKVSRERMYNLNRTVSANFCTKDIIKDIIRCFRALLKEKKADVSERLKQAQVKANATKLKKKQGGK